VATTRRRAVSAAPTTCAILIDRLHQGGFGVIMDWVPGHFPKDAFALARFDGDPLYEHPDPRRGEHKDWGTLIFDYGRNEVRNFLVANALYWFEEFHVDGLRVDAVASMLYLDYSREAGEWEPNIYGGRENLEAIRFLQEVNATAYKRYPGIAMIAEESTSFPGVTAPTSAGGLGFGLKWNMGWMNDSLEYIKRDPMYRGHHEGELSFSFVYAFSEHFVLPISHDEVVHGKGTLFTRMPGDHWQKLANTRAFLAYMWGHRASSCCSWARTSGSCPNGRRARTGLVDARSAAAPSAPRLRGCAQSRLPENSPLWARDSDGSAFRRLGAPPGTRTSSPSRGMTTGATPWSSSATSPVFPSRLRPGPARRRAWRELLNSDAEAYGGSGVGNFGTVHADDNGRATLVLPPLGVLWLGRPA
jgi:1,4-alpha-glucan branching enzyme